MTAEESFAGISMSAIDKDTIVATLTEIVDTVETRLQEVAAGNLKPEEQQDPAFTPRTVQTFTPRSQKGAE